MRNLPSAVKHIMIISLCLMIMTYLNEPLMARLFALNPITFIKRPWQLVTYMFMHGNFAHLFFNMYTLYVFGTVLERVWGTRKFLLYYFVTGIGAALVHIGVQWLTGDFALTVGASGAISGETPISRKPGLLYWGSFAGSSRSRPSCERCQRFLSFE